MPVYVTHRVDLENGLQRRIEKVFHGILCIEHLNGKLASLELRALSARHHRHNYGKALTSMYNTADFGRLK